MVRAGELLIHFFYVALRPSVNIPWGFYYSLDWFKRITLNAITAKK